MLRLEDAWIWDSWIADDGERYHLFFLKAPRALEDPRLRKLSRLTTERVLDVPDPRLAVLRATPDQFRATILHTLDPRTAP